MIVIEVSFAIALAIFAGFAVAMLAGAEANPATIVVGVVVAMLIAWLVPSPIDFSALGGSAVRP